MGDVVELPATVLDEGPVGAAGVMNGVLGVAFVAVFTIGMVAKRDVRLCCVGLCCKGGETVAVLLATLIEPETTEYKLGGIEFAPEDLLEAILCIS